MCKAGWQVFCPGAFVTSAQACKEPPCSSSQPSPPQNMPDRANHLKCSPGAGQGLGFLRYTYLCASIHPALLPDSCGPLSLWTVTTWGTLEAGRGQDGPPPASRN